jgi:hypothetical protein
MASLNGQQAPVRPVQHRQQTAAAQICVFNLESSPLCHQASKKGLEEKQLPITVPEIRLPGESSLLFENCQESSAKESLDK